MESGAVWAELLGEMHQKRIILRFLKHLCTHAQGSNAEYKPNTSTMDKTLPQAVAAASSISARDRLSHHASLLLLRDQHGTLTRSDSLGIYSLV